MSMSQRETRSAPCIRVGIYNQTYSLRSDGDGEYVRKLAEFVDDRMREVSAQTLIVDTVKVAILTSLKIADELHRVKELYEREKSRVDSVSSECSQMLEKVLEAPAPTGGEVRRQEDWSYEDIFEPLGPEKNTASRLGEQVAARLQSRRLAIRDEVSIDMEKEGE